jgi:septal ring-binding cell division protein DamX
MPHRVLQVVATLIVLIAISAFTLGVVNAPQRGRMPGEKVAGEAGAAPLAATDATPLSQDRIEGLTSTRELTPEEKEKAEADKEAKEEAAEAAKATAATEPPGVIPPGTPSAPAAGDKVGEILQNVTPTQEEAPH